MSEQEPLPAVAPATVPAAFVAELTERVRRTRTTIEAAAAAGEDDLVEAHLAELESLVRLAAAHDVALPDVLAYLDGHRAPVDLTGAHVVDLTGLRARTCA
ncbi:hypothetical protein [Kineococcus terrestris]|uniref:hypothetical protein n=1 Tax=Kineococcus terrestris TaxID=2044856 RepID=UPI0034DAF230